MYGGRGRRCAEYLPATALDRGSPGVLWAAHFGRVRRLEWVDNVCGFNLMMLGFLMCVNRILEGGYYEPIVRELHGWHVLDKMGFLAVVYIVPMRREKQ
jgi:hypothetical protein